MPIPSDEDMKRISRTVTYVERLQRSAPVVPSQQQFVAPIVQLIRVTGDPAVSGRYPAVVQDYDADADTWSDLTDADCYAIDPAGTAIAEGTYLARRWGEYNSLPVFTPTEQIEATPTQWGLVTDAAQSFGGVKTIDDGVITTAYFQCDFFATAVANFFGSISGIHSFTADSAITAESGQLYFGRPSLASPARSEAVLGIRVDSGSDECTTFHVVSNDPSVSVISHAILFGAGTSAPYYSIRHNSTQYDGISGTDGVGNVFVGGINTSLGSAGGVTAATTAGTLLISDGSSWLEKFPVVNGEGYIVTNEEGLIVASGV